jgi:hypothetical protein
MFQLKMFLFNALLFAIFYTVQIRKIIVKFYSIIIKFFGQNFSYTLFNIFAGLIFATIWHFTNKLVVKASEGFYAVPAAAAAASLTPEQIAAAVAAVQAAAPAAQVVTQVVPAAKVVSPALPPAILANQTEGQGPSEKSSLSSLSASRIESAKKLLSDLTPAQRAELTENANKN